MVTKTELAAAKAKFLSRRSISRSHPSSLRKLRRAERVGAGLRPLHMPMRFTLAQYVGVPAAFAEESYDLRFLAARAGLESPTEGTFASLHPTKGWRFQGAI